MILLRGLNCESGDQVQLIAFSTPSRPAGVGLTVIDVDECEHPTVELTQSEAIGLAVALTEAALSLDH